MEKSIVIHFKKFAKHERRYMFTRLWQTRPWVFLELQFPRPPRRDSHGKVDFEIQGEWFVVEEKDPEFEVPVETSG